MQSQTTAYFLAIDLPCITHELVYYRLRSLAEGSLRSASLDGLCISHMQRQPDSADAFNAEAGVWGFRVGTMKRERAFKRKVLLEYILQGILWSRGPAR